MAASWNLAVAAGVTACSGAGSRGEKSLTASTSGGQASSSGQAASCRSVDTQLGPVRTCGLTSDWASRIESQAARVGKLWGKWGQTITVTLCADDADFYAVADGVDSATAGVTTVDGIFLAPQASRSLTSQGRDILLAHEFTHARLRHVGDDPTALWVREAAAQWTATRRLQMRADRLWPNAIANLDTAKDSPPSTTDFQRDANLAYELSAAWFFYLEHVTGAAAVCDFVRQRPTQEQADVRVGSLRAGAKQNFPQWLRQVDVP